MAHRKRAHEEEEHVNHERWLVTYADMITLLMVLFIVLFAMSQVDQRKYAALKDGLAAGFGTSDSILDGSSSLLDAPGVSAIAPVVPDMYLSDASAAKTKAVSAPTSEAVSDAERKAAEAAAELDRLGELRKRVTDALRAEGVGGDVQTTLDGRGLTISLVSRHVVFDSNLADLTARGRRILDAVAPVLASVPDQLTIEGHTNQARGKPKYYASDWDLSAARAVTVLRYLNEVRGLPAARLAATGFGKVRPLVPVAQPDSQELNKRVDIVILSTFVDELPDLEELVTDGGTARNIIAPPPDDVAPTGIKPDFPVRAEPTQTTAQAQQVGTKTEVAGTTNSDPTASEPAGSDHSNEPGSH